MGRGKVRTGTGFFERVDGAARFPDFVEVLVLVSEPVVRCFGAVTRGFVFCFGVRSFAAFCARALPAGERLVAGFRRVVFPATTRLRVVDALD